MWYIYLLTNQSNDFRYIGMTSDINKRLKMHNQGKTKSTKSHRPFNKLVIIATTFSRIEARKLEKYYKSGIGREVLKERGIA